MAEYIRMGTEKNHLTYGCLYLVVDRNDHWVTVIDDDGNRVSVSCSLVEFIPEGMSIVRCISAPPQYSLTTGKLYAAQRWGYYSYEMTDDAYDQSIIPMDFFESVS